MLTTKYTTIEEIMEIVFRDYMFSPQRDEVAEWIWQCVGYLGIPYGLEEKVINSEDTPYFTVEDYRCPVPIDMHEIIGIKHAKTGINLEKSLNIYEINRIMEESISSSNTITVDGENIVQNNTDLEFDNTVYVSGDNSLYDKERLVYIEKASNFYFGFKEGDITIMYKAFPIDQYGYPMIPDDAKFIRAITTFVAKKIAYRMYLKDDLSKIKYDEIAAQYSFAVGSAKNKAVLPDPAMMESIKKLQGRLNPLKGHFANGFKLTKGLYFGVTNTGGYNA